MGKLSNRKVIVTGAAQGMGRAIAIEAAREGASFVTIVDIKDSGEDTANEIRQMDCQALFIKTDLSKLSDIEHMINSSAEAAGGIDVLINNAGLTDDGATGGPQTLDSLTEETWDLLMNINVKAIWRATRLALPHLKNSSLSPAVVNAASVASSVAYPGIPAYSVTKGAVKSLTQSMAVDLAAYNIRCNAYAPGAIETPMLTHSLDTFSSEERAITESRLSGPHLIKRLGKPEEVAKLVCFLASEEASFLTGSIYQIDAGTLAWRGNE
ncbi:dehydrogenase of unknown specificity, short-chain alcohol dehydrogenase like [Spongiibacter sp. IMCC21906]|uniref:SDR family NAD(P)-dependent oxidoreductase n=1 Tax=Spongiibacter sp. IMCC21906 TaxID=1620392 RepID=UPI00062E0098|nr:SDR family oxidoreductase [Spongiibacter sp. IMCC21906]AKH70337.1 dehydrogenase of unknown specificity, short-chain alcohol dehydrogenase like [Spongiibacter sp. IMCC21906]